MLILIPIILMLALGFITPEKKRVSARVFLFVLGGVFFLFLVFRSLLPASFIDPEGDAVVRVESQVDYLLKHKGWKEHPVIILVGSSATQYGINGHLLEQSLTNAGYPTTVLQFSLSGANHFERLFMLQLFLKEIGEENRKKLQKAPTLMLCEVFNAYDESPLYLFKKEAYSQRAITWFEPNEAWAAWKAWRASGKDIDISYWTLWEHFLLNRFAIGSFSSFELPRYHQTIEPFFSLSGTKKTFHYNQAATTFLETKQQVHFQKLYPGWEKYYQTLFEEMHDVVSFCGFYALPTLEPERFCYQKNFAAALPRYTTMLGPASDETMKSLLHEEYWFDGVHPQGQGAELVTFWLQKEIIQNWSQLFEQRWQKY